MRDPFHNFRTAPKVSGWLAQTKRLESLPTGVARIEAKRDDALKRVASAKENWEGYSSDDKARRTLRLEDGAAPEGGVASAPGAPPCAPGAACAGADATSAPAPSFTAPPAPPAPPPAVCNPACEPSFVCVGPGQCVSACNPPCGSRERCTDAGTCIADAAVRVARGTSASREACFPPCRKGFLCGPRGLCVSACNPLCGSGQRCTGEGGLCVDDPGAGGQATPAARRSCVPPCRDGYTCDAQSRCTTTVPNP